MPVQMESAGPIEQPEGHKGRGSSNLLRLFGVVVLGQLPMTFALGVAIHDMGY